MFELLLTRHAKSDWHGDFADIDRPLNKRGRADAEMMGRFLADHALTPRHALVSPARRARETFALMNKTWALKNTQVTIDNALYLADAKTLLAAAAASADTGDKGRKRLILITHNPGLDDAVTRLAASPPPYSDSGKLMVTAATAVFAVARIEDLREPASCRLTALYRPREIDGAK